MMIFKGIAAVDSEWGYAVDNTIPWKFPQDLKKFKELTEYSNVIMGRNTYLEMAARRQYPSKNKSLLPNRLSVIITSHNDLAVADDAIVVNNLDEIKRIPLKYDVSWCIGGNSIFDFGLNMASEWYITTLNKSYGCNKFFNKQKLMKNFNKDSLIYEDQDMEIWKWVSV
jgi:dihydrofolate reductase